MSLVVYDKESDVPKSLEVIRDNDEFFEGSTFLDDNEDVKSVLKIVDKAERISATAFKRLDQGENIIAKTYLSTGCKTILNVLAHQDKCFSFIECGNNAEEVLLHQNHGCVVGGFATLLTLEEYRGNYKCDIEYRGKRFTNVIEFLEEQEESYDGDQLSW